MGEFFCFRQNNNAVALLKSETEGCKPLKIQQACGATSAS